MHLKLRIEHAPNEQDGLVDSTTCRLILVIKGKALQELIVQIPILLAVTVQDQDTEQLLIPYEKELVRSLPTGDLIRRPNGLQVNQLSSFPDRCHRSRYADPIPIG